MTTPTNTPSRARTMWWGITLRCARCGSGHLFKKYFVMAPDCPRCGLHFEREQGYWTGALAFNIIATGGLFALIFITVLILTAPDIPVVPVLSFVLPIMLIGPIVFFPFSKTIWVAVDRAFLQRLDPNERFDERL